MQEMFSNCSSLISLPNISNWNIISVQNMEDMFEGCSSSLIIPQKFKQ